MTALYVFCALVTPDLCAATEMDLRDFHQRERHRYTLAAAIMFAVSIAANTAIGGAGLYASWMRDNVASILGLVFSRPQHRSSQNKSGVQEARNRFLSNVSSARVRSFF
jgi:hypothetical protein